MDNISRYNGYIEGYYGRILNWNERKRILNKLNEIGFNSYLYCPKEDLLHRINWRENYPNHWIKSFKNFCECASKLNIKVLIGISPGLDYNFNSEVDFQILLKKFKLFLKQGAYKCVLLFDDIEKSYDLNKEYSNHEGEAHAKLTNKIFKKLNQKIFFVPKVYADQLNKETPNYMSYLFKTLNKKITIFYCGKKIVSKTTKKEELNFLRSFTNQKVIFWDNFYANDYCPKNLFICPWIGRSINEDVMVNLTGMIETDLLLLEIISQKNKVFSKKVWMKILNKFSIPIEFIQINQHFKMLGRRQLLYKKNKSYDKYIQNIDKLLWKWKSPLSREWYPYLLNLKQELELINNRMNKGRIKKIHKNLYYFLYN